jgi:serine phosphatase RsbU (regulator of sigma subunit)
MEPAEPTPADPAPSPPRSRGAAAREFFFRTFAGRALVVGLLIKSAIWGLWFAGLDALQGMQVFSTLGGLALVVGSGLLAVRLAQSARRQLLWRVRRRLIISYLFVGFVPAVLIVTFFLVAGFLLFANLSTYLVRACLADLAEEAAYVARTATLEYEHETAARGPAILQRRMVSDAALYPGISIAVVPVEPGRCGTATLGHPAFGAVAAGPWIHAAAPSRVPAWVPCQGFAGVIAVVPASGRGDTVEVVLRALAFPADATGFATIVDVPFSAVVRARVEQTTGIGIGAASLGPLALSTGAEGTADDGGGFTSRVAFLDHVNWANGQPESLTMQITPDVMTVYRRLSEAQGPLGGGRNIGEVLFLGLLIIAGLFLIIEAGALAMGLALAKSITGAVHELFTGTERVRQGDFGHRIPVLAKDQLGELAASFNLMTGSIEDLLRQAAEKKRLEEEMRLAREIQMSLLPRGPLLIPGVTVSAMCVPAREVGGDYYDVLPLPDGRYGLLIADVSGKGMSAALYMAELKGLILSLSQIHESPRDLLIRANHLISEHLDSRSFITMTYAVIDPAAGRMTYARAGHTPLIFLPRGNGNGDAARAQVLTPDGMVLGLRIDRGERFEALLVESSLALGPGDLLVLFTDGISEAMNEHADFFGETRLVELLEEHAELPFEELRERILREIDAFVGGAPQHDDMTMILLKIDEPAADGAAPGAAATA